MVAHELDLPYVGIVTRLSLDASGRTALAAKEYPGGVRGEFEITLPAVLGIQAAEKPPRYVPVAKVRSAMRTLKIDCTPVPLPTDGGCAAVQVVEMKRNEPAGHAEMLDGSPESVSDKLCGILAGHGLL
jgi:electron transfer flavoprotein beta subunit